MAPRAEKIEAHWRLDSRGKPTVQARLTVGDIEVAALVPSGASTGSKEALELRDANENSFLGFGVEKVIRNITGEIAPAISKFDIEDQEGIDRAMIELDGTENKSRLGANAILAVSMAVARATAEYKQVPLYKHIAELHGEKSPTLLPTPMMNIINGGVHANNGLPFQEFMIVSVGAKSFGEAIRMGSEVYLHLGKLVNYSGLGDEGGYSPRLFFEGEKLKQVGRANIYGALDMLNAAIDAAGYRSGVDISIAIDVAANEIATASGYRLEGESILSSSKLISFYGVLLIENNIISIEDGLREDDPEWSTMTQALGQKIQIVGDDRFVTNPKIFNEGIQNGIANSILIKLNQIGTLTETLEVIRMAQKAGYNVIVSHRSGETEDTFIADLAVATRAGQIKAGAPARGERTAKYNRLLDIEQYDLPKMGLTPEYAGATPFRR